jgi:predicted DNA-binding transcriptional regulator YafY
MAYKHDYDKTLTRLITILTKLYNGDSLSVKELAVEFNVSSRTIQRDFNERLISFPIFQDKKFWKMQDGFRLEKSSNIEDSIILDIMEKLLDGTGKAFSLKAKKLLSKIKNEDFNPIYAKLNIEDIGDKLDIIQQLENAIKEKLITNCYYKIDSENYKLEIKPLKIVNFEGFWYLIALDLKDKDILKKYYLKNIFNIKVLTTNFKIDLKLEQLLENSISIWFQQYK